MIPRPTLYQQAAYSRFNEKDTMFAMRMGPSNDNTMAAATWDMANHLGMLIEPWNPDQKVKPATIT